MVCPRTFFHRVVALALIGAATTAAAAVVSLRVTEDGATAPPPCRVHIKDAANTFVLPEGYPAFRTHLVCPGEARFTLAPGDYSVAIERGPEYSAVDARWHVDDGGELAFHYQVKRITHLAREGWWDGDLHVHRALADIELLMRADDLHVAPVITWWNNQNQWAKQAPPKELLVRFDGDRFYRVMGGEDEREGGALLFFGLDEPLPIAKQGREYHSPMVFLQQARKLGAWIDIEKPFWWDVPVWLASGMVDSIGLANNHMQRHTVLENEAWGRARDRMRFPPPQGNGLWSQEIYCHILNTGLRLPPSAGSASGVLPNAVGYNRVYVHLDGGLSYDAWWAGLKAGRSFVTNGPLLRVRANGEWPGHVFRAAAGETLEIALEAQLDGRDVINRIEIVHNGAIARTISAAEWQRTRSLGALRVSESGWFLVRAIADVPETFRFASTAPFYVEVGGPAPRVSRASAQFFLDWVRERMGRIKLADPQELAEVMQYQLAAEKFWAAKVAAANAP